MAVAYLNSSTLSEAITKDQVEFSVGSTANISVGYVLVVRNEAMKVGEIPVSGRVRVRRGSGGTEARAHASGQRFWVASPEFFKSNKESLHALVGDAGIYPDYMLPGQRARDGQGNEYILVDATATMYSGSLVGISNDGLYTGAIAKGTVHQGSVGILTEQASSDQFVWVQIYGYNAFCQSGNATTGITSAWWAIGSTIVSTPNVGFFTTDAATSSALNPIHGMFIVGGGSSAVTLATSSTGYAVPVFLHYPYMYNRLEELELNVSST